MVYLQIQRDHMSTMGTGHRIKDMERLRSLLIHVKCLKDNIKMIERFQEH